MEAGDAGNGSAAAVQTKGSGDDASHKPLPPCCVKAKAGVPESEAKCHETVVSGWFTEPRSRFGMFQDSELVAILEPYIWRTYVLSAVLIYSTDLIYVLMCR